MAVLRSAVAVAIALATVAVVCGRPVERYIEYPKCYKTSSECSYYGKEDIGCCDDYAKCMTYGEKGEGKYYCLKYNYYYYDEGSDPYCYAYDGKKVYKSKKPEYYSYEAGDYDGYKKVVHAEDYYKKLSKIYDDDMGKYYYKKDATKVYVEEYFHDEGKRCFYDEYGVKVYDFFYYGYDGSVYTYSSKGKKCYIEGDMAYYYKDDGVEKEYLDFYYLKSYYEEDGVGVYKYDPSGHKYYITVEKPEYIEKYHYVAPSKKKYTPVYYPKAEYYKKESYAKYEKFDYGSYYYGKKVPGKFIDLKPISSPTY